MSENGEAGRRIAIRTLLMTGVAVILIGSSVAWFNNGVKIVGLVQLAIGGLVGVGAILYGRLSRR